MLENRFTHYLNYLDKEMTIMGLLSSFSIAVIAALIGGFKFLGQAANPAELWEKAACPASAAVVFLLVAAYFFYYERSHLAWHYGYITYHLAAQDESSAMESLEELQGTKQEWRWYLHGLYVLAAGLVLIAGAFWFARNPHTTHSWKFTAIIHLLLGIAVLVQEYRIRRDLIGFNRKRRHHKKPAAS